MPPLILTGTNSPNTSQLRSVIGETTNSEVSAIRPERKRARRLRPSRKNRNSAANGPSRRTLGRIHTPMPMRTPIAASRKGSLVGVAIPRTTGYTIMNAASRGMDAMASARIRFDVAAT